MSFYRPAAFEPIGTVIAADRASVSDMLVALLTRALSQLPDSEGAAREHAKTNQSIEKLIPGAQGISA